MTADRITAIRVVPGDVIRTAHHHEGNSPCLVGCREIDVEVVGVAFAGMRLVVECRACMRFPGARASLSLVLVLERTDHLMRIGHPEEVAA